jgi:hypothetical protein
VELFHFASSFVGVVSMLLSVVFGSLIEQLYNQTLLPLVVFFFALIDLLLCRHLLGSLS